MWPTPDGISDEEASQFETVITPASLVREVARVEPGDRVVVSGPGTIGLLAANIARIDGASHVTVLGGPGDEKERLPIALKMGAHVAEVMSPESLARLEGDAAPRCWIEASGAAPAIEAAVAHVAPGGRISISGLGEGPWNVDMARVAWDSIAIEGRWGGSGEQMPDCARLMAEKKLRVDLAITHVMPLTEWREAFDMLRRKEGLKIVLDPAL
jgi:threonine dehydrogenase-like Zn-dependent dehydrogenase